MIADNQTAQYHYELWLLSDKGERIALLDGVQSFDYTKAVNSAGQFKLTLKHYFDVMNLQKDRRIAIYRKPYGGTLALDFMGIIETIGRAGRVANRMCSGPSLNGLLERREVLYYAGSTKAAYSAAYADNAMKQIVRENLGASATTGNARYVSNAISASYFSTQADTSQGATIDKQFAWRKVSDVLREISDASRQAGTEIFYEIVPITESTFEFQTFKMVRGIDRRDQITFGVEYGNLDEPVYTESWSDEINYAVAGGQGENVNRALNSAEDTARSGVSIFGKTEGFVNATNVNGTAAVVAAALLEQARSKVNAGRPKKTFSARIVNAPQSLYGVHWGFGDYVTATYDGLTFDAMIRAVTVKVDDNGLETITARIEAYA